MKYALNLNDDNRILSACVALPNTPADLPRVDTLLEGDVSDWLYQGGKYVYDPLPRPEPPAPEPSADDVLNALLGVTSDE